MKLQFLNYYLTRIIVVALTMLIVFVGQLACTVSTTEESDNQKTSPTIPPMEESTGVPTQPNEIPRVSKEDLLQQMENKEGVLIVDTRFKVEYDQGHMKGAISVPLSEIALRKWQPPPSQEVILYCNWPEEETSASSALMLVNQGFPDVKVLDGGWSAWKKAGYPIEK